MSTKPKDNPQHETNSRTRFVIPPLAWLVLQAGATVAWLIGIAWGGYLIVRWLFG